MSFGYALTDAVDVDNNKYPGLSTSHFLAVDWHYETCQLINNRLVDWSIHVRVCCASQVILYTDVVCTVLDCY